MSVEAYGRYDYLIAPIKFASNINLTAPFRETNIYVQHFLTFTPTFLCRCVLCPGASYPPTLPRPLVSSLPLQMPVCEVGTEKGQLEVSLLTWLIVVRSTKLTPPPRRLVRIISYTSSVTTGGNLN